MENKHKNVKPKSKMYHNIRSEMKRHGQINEDIADLLNVTPVHYSRMINGYNPMDHSYITKLSKIWGVREEYLLGNDSYRTNEELCTSRNVKYNKSNKAVLSLLSAVGYDFEFVEVVAVSVKMIEDMILVSGYTDVLDDLEEYISDRSDSWHHFRAEVTYYLSRPEEQTMRMINPKYEMMRYFRSSGDYTDKLINELDDVSNNIENLKNTTRLSLLFRQYARIMKDGELIGYYDIIEILEIVKKNACFLFESLLGENMQPYFSE